MTVTVSVAGYAVALLLALGGAAVGVFGLLPLGLVLPEALVYSLALLAGGLGAGLAAGWAGRRLVRGGGSAAGQPSLLAAVVAGETAAVLLALAVVAGVAPRVLLPWPPALAGLLWSVVLAAAASGAAWRVQDAPDARRDRRLTVRLLLAAVAGVAGAITLAAAAGLAGA